MWSHVAALCGRMWLLVLACDVAACARMWQDDREEVMKGNRRVVVVVLLLLLPNTKQVMSATERDETYSKFL